MIANRYAAKIAAALMLLLVILCLCAMVFSPQLVAAAGGTGVRMEYESKLFDTSQVLEINILMDDQDWQAMLENASPSETGEFPAEGWGGQGQQPPEMENMPNRGGAFGPGADQMENSSGTLAFYYGLAAVVLLAAFLLVLFYHRRPRKR
ncbi:MAG: hypothetical protein H9864_03900 [Candidatus Faecalibacterium intestinavium]|uniref:Gram-positive cocci surface proteins LPxTG domain-containing protein n=1 Tax=Candidatus Faecalibacterium intestinavium TaxID=2838580 RepID=A0A9E2NQ88_9FIRM|nr:hypothetical protein [Candidatus Faecalibacterium intestinavium]